MKSKSTHRFIAAIILVVLTQQMFINTFIVVDFLIHQDYIAKNLCVQKDDQQGCNGKCHLHKVLEENKHENGNSPQENTPRSVVKFDYLFSKNETCFELFSSMDDLKHVSRFSSEILVRYDEVLTPPPELA